MHKLTQHGNALVYSWSFVKPSSINTVIDFIKLLGENGIFVSIDAIIDANMHKEPGVQRKRGGKSKYLMMR